MPKCRAIRDGLIGTSYIFAGEEFRAEVCPKWAEVIEEAPAEKPAPKAPAKKPDEKAGK